MRFRIKINQKMCRSPLWMEALKKDVAPVAQSFLKSLSALTEKRKKRFDSIHPFFQDKSACPCPANKNKFCEWVSLRGAVNIQNYFRSFCSRGFSARSKEIALARKENSPSFFLTSSSRFSYTQGIFLILIQFMESKKAMYLFL